MRKIMERQMKIGEVGISTIKFDLRSRDEIPKILMGLQHIYSTPSVRNEVFKVLKDTVPKGTDSNNGRPGMDLWKILVLGTIRLGCNCDYDKLQEMANNHKTLRQMLGHETFDDYLYALQTLKDNVSLVTPEVLDKINQVVVKAGHTLVGQKEGDILKGKCDSVVLETDVHYPTDINLLFDAIVKVIHLITLICLSVGIPGWRQSQHNIKKIKKLFRKAQNLKHSTSKNEKQKTERQELIIAAHQAYLDLVESFLEKVKETIKMLREEHLSEEVKLLVVEKYIKDAQRQINQIRTRVIEGKDIPHNEKVFSIFEEHTEWICKGKAGVSQELGLRVCILEDQYGFILHYQVMEKQTDDKVTVAMVKEAKEKFPRLSMCSFDKGFYTPRNLEELRKLLEKVILPKKGKLSSSDKEVEYSEEFIQARRKHSAIESAINALENHGLDRCPDHGITGLKRYVALAVLARNIQILGNIVQQKSLKRQRRIEKLERSRQDRPCRIAA
jgi:transposase, IS5 family